MLVEKGGGNPYFIEELVQWLIEQAVLRPGSEVWALAEAREAVIGKYSGNPSGA